MGRTASRGRLVVERRKKLLTEGDLDDVVDRIIEAIKQHSCSRGITDEDAVFLRKLRRGSESTASMIWKAVLALIGVCFVLLMAAGAIAAGFKMLRSMGVNL